MRFLLIAILASSTAFGAYTEYYVQTTGSNLNAGSTATDAAAFTYAGGTFVRATGVYTVASGNPLTDGVAVGDEASIYTTAGATQPGVVGRVTARDATTITINTTDISGATANVSEGAAASTLKIGGAWAGPSTTVDFPFGFILATGVNASGDPVKVWIKGGTAYSATDTITQDDAGITYEGYTSATGDGGRAEINGQANGTPFNLFNITAAGCRWRNIDWNGNHDATGASAQATGNYMVILAARGNYFYNCRFRNGYRGGIQVGGSGDGSAAYFEECLFELNQFDDANDMAGCVVAEESNYVRCRFSRNGAVRHADHASAGGDSAGVKLTNSDGEPASFEDCIFDFNAGDGIETGSSALSVRRCSFYNNGTSTESGDGIDTSAGNAATALVMMITESIFHDNALYGIRGDSSIYYPTVKHCAFRDNVSGDTLNVNASFITGTVTLTADPWVDPLEGDFDLNSTAGGGAALKGVGLGTFQKNASEDTGTTLSTPDIGASQSAAGAAAVTRGYIGLP